MKSVIMIEEECHGLIGLASSFKSAIIFLIEEKWITGDTCLYYRNSWDGVAKMTTLWDKYGEDWIDEITNWSQEDFEENFDGIFYFSEMEVFSIDNLL